MRTILRDLLEDALKLAFRNMAILFNRAGIEELNRQHQARKINVGYHLWGLLILFLWMKKWKAKVPALAAR